MTAHRDSLPSCYPVHGGSNDLLSSVLDLGSFTYSHIEGIVVLVGSITCVALSALLWVG